MIPILFVTFMACHPAQGCDVVEIPVRALTVLACSHRAIMVAAAWIGEHEGFEIRGPITCSAGREV